MTSEEEYLFLKQKYDKHRTYNISNGVYLRVERTCMVFSNVLNKRHRLDGPAFLCCSGGLWFINGFDVTIEIYQWAEENDIELDNLTDVDKALIKIVWADYGK